MPGSRGLVGFAKEVLERGRADGLTDGSAALAYWIFLSIFPALIAFVALLGTMETFIGQANADKIRREIISKVDNVLEAGKLLTLRNTINDILSTPRGGLAVVGLVGAIYGVSKGFSGLCRVMARIHGQPEARYGLKGRIVGLVLGLGTLLVALLGVTVFVLGPEFLLTGDSVARTSWLVVRGPLALALSFVWLVIVLKVAPGMSGPLRSFVPGALVAAGLIIGLGIGTVVVVRLGLLEANPLLGVLGTVILVLGLLNLLARAVLLGGEVNDVRLRRIGVVEGVRPQDVVVAPTPPSPAAQLAAVALVAAGFLFRRR
jgi:membrane protein